MNNKPITIKDLARILNINVSTVSRALRDNPEISAKTRKKVQDLAKQLNYVPNPIAVALKTNKSYTIGVIVPTIVNSFFSNVVVAIEEYADKMGYNVLVASSNEQMIKEMKNINIFKANSIDGIIISLSQETDNYDHIKRVCDSNIPLVMFDRTTKELNASKVVADDSDAASMAIEHLISLKKKNIAILTGPNHLLISKNRLKGYIKALQNNKIHIKNELIINCELDVHDAKKKMLNALNKGIKIDAVFGISDDLAIGAIQACEELGINIPEDIAIVGFSNSNRSQYMKPSLSTLNLFPNIIGYKAAELLFEQIKKPKDFKIKKEIVKAELIIRDSSNL